MRLGKLSRASLGISGSASDDIVPLQPRPAQNANKLGSMGRLQVVRLPGIRHIALIDTPYGGGRSGARPARQSSHPCGQRSNRLDRENQDDEQVSPIGKAQSTQRRTLSSDQSLLDPHLETLPIKQGTLLQEAGEPIDQVYFPQGGMISLLATMSDGQAIETATVGNEGVVGAMSGLGPGSASRGQ